MVEHRPSPSTENVGADERTERIVSDIMRRAAPELRRRAPAGVASTMSRWRRGILAGAAGLAAASLCALFLVDSNRTEVQGSEPVLTEAVLPPGIAEWLGSSEGLDPLRMIAAFEEVAR
jgi:hypothetical protein